MRSGIFCLAVFACFLVQAYADGVDVKVCCISDAAYDACNQMVDAFFGGQPEMGDDDGRRKLMAGHITWTCVKPGGVQPEMGDDDGRRKLLTQGSVMEMIQNGDCNFGMDMDAHDVYDAKRDYGWEAIVGEDYGDGEGLTYYGIAVVPSSVCEANPNVSLADFRGKRSCHTGYKRTSGWTIPLATILTLESESQGGVGALQGKTDAEIMTGFFPEMCTAGAPDEFKDVMCKNCIGDCKRGPGEPYMGYAGALRCLMEDAGDIAFMKQSTPTDYASDGAKPQPWSTLSVSDLKLVCPGGGCAAPADYDKCNYARIPSHMIAVSGDLPVNEIRSQFMEAAGTKGFADWLSGSPALFNKKTQGLIPIQEDTIEYMGKLTDVYDILEDLNFI